MSDAEFTPQPGTDRRFGLWLVASVVGVLLLTAGGTLFVPLFSESGPVRMMPDTNNCRQIMIALKSYAGDHDGRYPDTELAGVRTSNEVLRELVKRQLLEDERVFTATSSPSRSVADNNIGEAPDFIEALEPGENHWCMVRGLTDASDGHLAFVFENPVDDTWPPVWNADQAGQSAYGRAKKGGKIVIGRLDGSVNLEQLASDRGTRVSLSDKDNAVMFPPGGSFLPVAK